MRIAFIADGRAEHTRRWLYGCATSGATSASDVLLLSTYPCAPLPGVRTIVLPGLVRAGDAFVKGSAAQASPAGQVGRQRAVGRVLAAAAPALLSGSVQPFWQQLKLVDILGQAVAARWLLRRFQPAVVHALRMQNEGYVAALAGWRPWIVSLWGQDIVLFARRYPLHRLLTAWALRRADALTADCARDIGLARQAGLPAAAPTRIFPTNGGVDRAIYAAGPAAAARERLLVYPRGITPYTRLDTLLRALHLLAGKRLLDGVQTLLLVQPALVSQACQMVAAYPGLAGLATVEPMRDQAAWAGLLRRAAVMVSPTVSDGTPNTLLEAMACGAFPVVSDLEPIREWLRPGRDGVLFDPTDPTDLAGALLAALGNPTLRQQAQTHNQVTIDTRAARAQVWPQVAAFYAELAAARCAASYPTERDL